MQVENIQISGGAYKNNNQNKAKVKEGFSQILYEINNLKGENSLQYPDEELVEEDELNVDEAINFIFNMPLISTREVKLSIPMDEEIEEVERVEGSKIIYIDSDEHLLIEQDPNYFKGFKDSIAIGDGDLIQRENEVHSQENIDELVSKAIEEMSISKGIDTEDKSLKKQSIEDIHLSKEDVPILDRDIKVQEDSEVSFKDYGEKADLDRKPPLEKRKVEAENKEWTSIDIERNQPKIIEHKGNINLQDNILSRENIEIIDDSIIQLLETTTEQGTSTMKVKLHPEELGSVDITLTMDEGKLIARILVDSDHVKQLFSGSIDELNQNLLKQNIYIENLQVDLNNSSSENQQHNNGNYFTPRKSFNFSKKSLDDSSPEERIYETGAVSILA